MMMATMTTTMVKMMMMTKTTIMMMIPAKSGKYFREEVFRDICLVNIKLKSWQMCWSCSIWRYWHFAINPNLHTFVKIENYLHLSTFEWSVTSLWEKAQDWKYAILSQWVCPRQQWRWFGWSWLSRWSWRRFNYNMNVSKSYVINLTPAVSLPPFHSFIT